jgi:hypothetical protein
MDFRAENHGSVVLLAPVSEQAQAWWDEYWPVWCDKYRPEDAPRFADSYVVESRYIEDIVTGITGDGMSMLWRGMPPARRARPAAPVSEWQAQTGGCQQKGARALGQDHHHVGRSRSP